jgi:hypothetical protein
MDDTEKLKFAYHAARAAFDNLLEIAKERVKHRTDLSVNALGLAMLQEALLETPVHDPPEGESLKEYVVRISQEAQEETSCIQPVEPSDLF